ncbi:MAG: hypothetical protein M1823_005364, partial [Watsoniomyces obsoletus]
MVPFTPEPPTPEPLTPVGSEHDDLPRTPHRQQMTRDERVRAQALRDAGHKVKGIAIMMGKTYWQIRTALSSRPTP